MKKDIYIGVKNLFTGEVLAASGHDTSGVVGLSMSGGVCKVQYAVTGTGTVKIEVLESINGVTYVTNGTPLGSTLTGNGIIAYSAAGVPFAKFKITEDGGAAGATVTLDIAVS